MIRQMKVVGIHEARTQLAKLLARVAKGEEITITKHGSPIAKLVPVKKKPTVEQRRAAIARFRQISKGITLGGLKIKDLINEGRP